MSLRFRRRVRLMPGVSVNLGMKGASVSLGRRGARVTVGPAGVRTTVELPGTGISYTTQAKPALVKPQAPAPGQRQAPGKHPVAAFIVTLVLAGLLAAWLLG